MACLKRHETVKDFREGRDSRRKARHALGECHPTGPHRRRNPACGGSSLPEVLIALLILAGVVTGFGRVVHYTGGQTRHHRLLSRAVELLDSNTEALLLRAPGDPALDMGLHSQEYDFHGHPVLTGTGFYQIEWQVEPCPTREDILQIQLSSSWNEGGRERRIGWTAYRP